MKNNCLIFFIFITNLLAAQAYESIHQLQSKYYSSISTPPVDKVHVKTGIDILLDKKQNLIADKRIALVTNQTGVDQYGVANYKRLMDLENTKLEVVFSPEHGIFGETDKEVTYNDGIKNLPKIYSLYGAVRKPTREMLDSIDIIIYDIQDIGARFYTYISTLGLVMEAAAELNIPVLVLDRPNPIRGDIVEGPILDIEYQSFIGKYPIPIRYGWTVAELAEKIIQENWINPTPQLTVIPMEGWNTSLWYDETTLPWIKPSPNIPNLETALIYPGMCLLEGTNISEGRGTNNPFQWFGAPWIDSRVLSQKLNNLKLSGVVFVPKSFIPISIPGVADKPKYENQLCYGIEIRVVDRNKFNSVKSGVNILKTINEMYPDSLIIKEKRLNKLWGSDTLLTELKEKKLSNNFFAAEAITILLLFILLIN
ncbi:MAG: exo-beta-N-acetylmuramidase NamZ domain-containing protein [Candidatus Neomarinimicrobiota bacterium]